MYICVNVNTVWNIYGHRFARYSHFQNDFGLHFIVIQASKITMATKCFVFLLLLETLCSTSLTPMSCLKVNTWFRCNQWTKWRRISTCRIQVYVHPLNLTHITSTYLLKIPYLLAPGAYLSVDYHKYNWIQLLKPSISTFAKLSIMCIAYV